MNNFHKYPSIRLTKNIPEIFAVKEVIATEKLDGSNFRLFFPEGMSSIEEIQYGSRETEYIPGTSFALGGALLYFKEKPNLLNSIWQVIKDYDLYNVTIFGEMYGPGINSKGVKYTNDKNMLFRAFDIMVCDNFLTYDLFCEVADKMGIGRVHEVWRGSPSIEAFDNLLEKPSTEALVNGISDQNNIAEGVVIRSNPLFRNSFGEWLIVKHKSKKFTEVKAILPNTKKPNTIVELFVETYITEGRVRNAIGRLQDKGVVLANHMKDMPILLPCIVADLHKECENELQALGLSDKQLQTAISKNLAIIYRDILQ